MDKHLFEQNYIGLKQIGKGGSGVIYRAYHRRLAQYVVLKQMLVAGGEREARREVDILKALKHSYLPKIYDFVEVGGVYYTVEEYIEGCDLSAYMKTHGRPPEALVLKWLRQMCEVLQYLHGEHIIHSDIKPGNIMIERGGNICLIDFNISIQRGRRVRGYTGCYCSPEQLRQARAIQKRQDPSGILVDHRSDIYSTAATFYTLMTGIMPERDAAVRPLASMRLEYTEGLCRFVDKGMERDADRRWQSTGQMLAALAHLDKLTQRYERYVKLRALVSTCGVLLAAAGILCCLQGTQVIKRESFSQAYKAFCSSYEENGATEEVYEQAAELLSSDSYDSLLEGSEKRAKLLTIEGDYASEENEYADAADYYCEALEAAEDADLEDLEAYALNYASALARSGSSEDAQSVARQYCDDDALRVIQAESAYCEKDYAEVLEIAHQSADTSQYEEYICKVAMQAAEELEDWDEALSWGEKLCELNPQDTNYREAAELCMDAGAAEGEDAYYRDAITYYEKLSVPQYDDTVNRATAYTLLGKYSKSQSLLDSVDAEDDSILCRVYFTSAQNYIQLDKEDKAKTSCQEAIRCYNRLSAKEKKEEKIAAQLNRLREQLGVQEELE